MELLKQLCSIHAPSSEETPLQDFILSWIQKNKKDFVVKPVIINTPEIQDSLVLVFGKPRTVIFAHMDSTGFTVRYHNELIYIGGPDFKNGDKLVGFLNGKQIETKIVVDKKHKKTFCDYKTILPAGTSLTYKPNFKVSKTEIVAPYLDDRLGVWVALQVAKTLKDGIIVFSCNEEHGGGSVEKVSRVIFKKYKILQALISDITWATDGIFCGKGVVVTMRDKFIPRKSYTDKICNILKKNGIKYRAMEVICRKPLIQSTGASLEFLKKEIIPVRKKYRCMMLKKW
jgi:putative aminopeptidase FrvX